MKASGALVVGSIVVVGLLFQLIRAGSNSRADEGMEVGDGGVVSLAPLMQGATPTPAQTPTPDSNGYIGLTELNQELTVITTTLSTSAYSTTLQNVQTALDTADATWVSNQIETSRGLRISDHRFFTAQDGGSRGDATDAYSMTLDMLATGTAPRIQGYIVDTEEGSDFVCLALYLYKNNNTITLPTPRPSSMHSWGNPTSFAGDSIMWEFCELLEDQWYFTQWLNYEEYHPLLQQHSAYLDIDGKTFHIIRP